MLSIMIVGLIALLTIPFCDEENKDVMSMDELACNTLMGSLDTVTSATRNQVAVGDEGTAVPVTVGAAYNVEVTLADTFAGPQPLGYVAPQITATQMYYIYTDQGAPILLENTDELDAEDHPVEVDLTQETSTYDCMIGLDKYSVELTADTDYVIQFYYPTETTEQTVHLLVED